MLPDETIFQTIGARQEAQATSVADPGIPEISGYTLEHALGAGSFGEVWGGKNHRTGQRVAVKVLSSEVSQQKLEIELSRLATVTGHPNVVQLLDADVTHSPPYLSMPWLTGGTLAQAPEADLKQKVIWIQQIAEALKFIHGKGVLHCDLKPSNILLDEQGRAKLADFGQSLALGGTRRAWGTLGTMAPEQSYAGNEKEGSTPNVSWDIYALGATAYYLLTGRLPRVDSTFLESIAQSETLEDRMKCYRELLSRTPLRPLNSSIDRELAWLVESSLHVDPQQRPSSAEEFLEDLRRRDAGQPLLCRRPWALSYQVFCFLRRPLVSLSVAFLLLAVLGTGYGYRKLAASNQELNQTVAQLRSSQARLLEARGEDAPDMPQLWYAQALQTVPDDRVLRRKLNRPRLWLKEPLGEGLEAGFHGSKLIRATQNSLTSWDGSQLPGVLRALSRAGTTAIINNQGKLESWALDSPPRLQFSPPGAFRSMSRDGQTLAIEQDGKQVAFSASGSRLTELPEGADFIALADGGTGALAKYNNHSVQLIWKGRRVTVRAPQKRWPDNRGGFVPGKDWLLFRDREVTEVWDTSGEEILGSMEQARWSEFTFAHDGASVFLTSSDKLEHRSLPDLKLIQSAPISGLTHDMALSPDQRHLAILTGQTLQLWDATHLTPQSPQLPVSGEAEKSYRLADDGLAWSSDGSQLVTWSKEIRIWGVEAAPAQFTLPGTRTLAWDGEALLALSGPDYSSKIRGWDLSTGTPLERPPTDVRALGGGRAWLLGDDSLLLQVVQPGVESDDLGADYNRSLDLVALRQNEKLVVRSISDKREVFSKALPKVIKPALDVAGRPRYLDGSPMLQPIYPEKVALSPDGKQLAHSDYKSLSLITLPRGEPKKALSLARIRGLQYSPDGRFLVVSAKRSKRGEPDRVLILNLPELKEIHRIPTASYPQCTPDGNYLFVQLPAPVHKNGKFVVMEAGTWKELYRHPGWATVAPQGDYVVANLGRELRILDPTSGRALSPTLKFSAKLRNVVCDPNKPRFAVVDSKGRISVHHVPQPVKGKAEDVLSRLEGWLGKRLHPLTGHLESLSESDWRRLSKE